MKELLKKLNNKRSVATPAIVIAVALFSHWRWFFTSWTLTDGDWHAQFREALLDRLSIPQIWAPGQFGSVDLSLSMYPFNILSALIARLGADYWFVERAVFMWPIVILSAVGSYLLVRNIVKNNIASLIGSFAFCYNTYFLLTQTGQLTLAASFAAAPLVFLYFMRSIEKRSHRDAIIAGLWAFVMSFFEFRALYITIWLLIFYFIWQWLTDSNKKLFIKSRWSIVLLPAILLLGLNIYWILPLTQLQVLANNDIFSRGLFGNSFLDVIRAFTLSHPFWSGRQPTAFVIQPIPWYGWLIPIIAFLGLAISLKNKKVVYFGAIALVGIFLTKQVSLPFGQIYSWLYHHFPGFSAYREASKFFFVVSIGYAVLIAAAADWISNLKLSSFVKIVVLLIIASTFLINILPLVNGDVRTLFVAKNPDQDYQVFRSKLKSDNTFYRTLWVPRGSRWSYSTALHPAIGAINPPAGIWRGYLPPIDSSDSTVHRMEQLFLSESSEQLFRDGSIRYVVVPVPDNRNDEDLFSFYDSRGSFIDLLNRVPYLKKLDWGLKSMVVYENQDVSQFVTGRSAGGQVVPLTYSYLSPTEIDISSPNNDLPVIKKIFISQAYDPNWRVVDMGRAFTVSPIKSSSGLQEYNLDGKDLSNTTQLKAIFIPQRLTTIGFGLSLTLLVSLLVAMLLIRKDARNS